MIYKAYAKVNLALKVIGKREDGYHELDMLMIPIDLYDKLKFKVTDQPVINLTCNTSKLSSGKKNLVYQAASLFIKTFNITKGVSIHLEKRIPSKAGLAGGSSDAATTLLALNKIFNVNADKQQLIDLASKLGSDVPFFIEPGLSRVRGRGEIIEPLLNRIPNIYEILLVKPHIGVQTGKAFNLVDFSDKCEFKIDDLVSLLDSSQYELFYKSLQNDLEKPAISLVPKIDTIKRELHDYGFDAVLMSGSGSTVFAISSNKDIIVRAKKHFLKQNYFVYHTKFIQ